MVATTVPLSRLVGVRLGEGIVGVGDQVGVATGTIMIVPSHVFA